MWNGSKKNAIYISDRGSSQNIKKKSKYVKKKKANITTQFKVSQLSFKMNLNSYFFQNRYTMASG